jgi:hypothetical protein
MSTSHSNGTGFREPTDAAALDSSADPQVIPGNSEFGNRYPRAFKLKVLRETEACTKSGELGKYLRRMGLTHATLTCFRKQRAAGTLDASVATVSRKQRTPITDSASDRVEQARRLMELERENRKLRRQLDQAETVIEIQKKVSHLLEISLDNSVDNSQMGPGKAARRSG